MKKTMIGALALVAMAAVPAGAQQHDHAGMQGNAQMHSQVMMQMHRAHAAVEHRQELGISAEQARRIAAVDSAQMAAMREHCRQVMAAGGPSAQTHAAMHPAMMAQLNGFTNQVNGILTAPQKARLDSLIAAHHGPGAAGHDMAAMHAQHGGGTAQGGSEHAAHHGAGGDDKGHAPCPIDGCPDADCCRMMGCDEQHGDHAGHSGHTAR
jgi:hypothetical protein